MDDKKIRKYKVAIGFTVLLVLELTIFIILSSFFTSSVSSGGNQTVVVNTSLTVGNVAPEIFNVSITDYSGANITLIPDSFKTVYCLGIVRDFNNRTDIANVSAQLFWKNSTYFDDTDDNNTHYSNESCYINTTSNVTYPSYGDDATGNFTISFNCSFNVQYYANPGTWNCSAISYDYSAWNGTNSSTIGLSSLIAISLPSSINYGTVNATSVSEENITNVTNVGNTQINLSLNGYSQNMTDNLAMNCTKGSSKIIPIMYEKFNLTGTTATVTGLTDFENHYQNLSNTVVTKRFLLNYRQNDSFNEAFNSTYWRIYVPKGVAGTCEGKIVFAGTTANGTS